MCAKKNIPQQSRYKQPDIDTMFFTPVSWPDFCCMLQVKYVKLQVLMCISRCSATWYCCNRWLFELLLSLRSLAILHWPISLKRYFCPQKCCLLAPLHTQSHLDHISSCLVWTISEPLDHVCMLLYIELLPHKLWVYSVRLPLSVQLRHLWRVNVYLSLIPMFSFCVRVRKDWDIWQRARWVYYKENYATFHCYIHISLSGSQSVSQRQSAHQLLHRGRMAISFLSVTGTATLWALWAWAVKCSSDYHLDCWP